MYQINRSKVLEEQNWVTEVGDTDNDFDFEGELPTLVKQDNKIYQYDQYAMPEHRKDCTIFSAFGAMSDLWNYELTPLDIQEIKEMATARGKTDTKGREIVSWVKLIADRWNTRYPEKQTAYFRVVMSSDQVAEAIEKNYTIPTGYRWNVEYVVDHLKDWILDLVDLKQKRTYKHAISIINHPKTKFGVKDNYKSRWEFNIYGLSDYRSLIKNWVFEQIGYLYVPTEKMQITLEELKKINVQKKELRLAIEANSTLWNATKDPEKRIELNKKNNELRSRLDSLIKLTSK